MEEEEEWPSARWKFLGCPFTDEEREDIKSIEREILEDKYKRKRSLVSPEDSSTSSSSITSNLANKQSTEPLQIDNQNWIQRINALFAFSETEIDKYLSDDLKTSSSGEAADTPQSPRFDLKGKSNKNIIWSVSSSSGEEETIDGIKLTVPSTSIYKSRYPTNGIEETDAPSSSTSVKQQSSKTTVLTWLKGLPDVQFVKNRRKNYWHDPSEEKKAKVKSAETASDIETVPEQKADEHIGHERVTDTHAGPERETDEYSDQETGTYHGRKRKTGTYISPLQETDTLSRLERETDQHLGPQRYTVVVGPGQDFVTQGLREPDTTHATVTQRDVTPTESDIICSEETASWAQRTSAFDLRSQQTEINFGYYLQPLLKAKQTVSESDCRTEKKNKQANFGRILLSTDTASETSCFGSPGSSGTLLPNQTDFESIQRESAERDKPLFRRRQENPVPDPFFRPKRDPFWFKSPRDESAKGRPVLPTSSENVSSHQNVDSESSLDSDIMSSPESSVASSSGKPHGAKERREKEKERREKEKEKREEKREKEKEKKEKERERREKERKGREKREKERKEKEEREKEKKEREERERREKVRREREEKEKREKDRKEREEKERKEREERHRVAAGAVTQATEPAPGPADISDNDGQHGFFWRMFHTLAHLLFICLLLLTIGSLGLGVSSLFARSAAEVAHHFQQGLTEASYLELCVALVGFLFFLLVLALTVLCALMLIPALWVSLIEIIVCPWSVISDYFLP